MWRRALAAGVVLGATVGVAGTLLLLEPDSDPPRLPVARQYASADGVIAAMTANGTPCRTVMEPLNKYPVCRLPDGALVRARHTATPGGYLTGGMPVGIFLAGPDWVVSSQDGHALADVQRAIGGQLRTV